ncbi:MAG: UDP-N-acetylmuramoyl-tripeptide--D-alanyl-D-alanine ligase [Jatrophihabitans sp.]
MIATTLGAVAATTAGKLGGGATAISVVPGPVEFDSRQVTPGCLFLALPGEQVDGHDYVGGAIADGAVAALVTRPVGHPHVVVEDGLLALGALAAASVRGLPHLTTIGITGSSGKTSTKDLVGELLGRLGPTLAPRESFNNELGHPYTVLKADTETRYLVLELSARGVGHIRYLAGIAPPRIGVVLNVGSAHLGGFGSRAAIAQAKGELVEALPLAADGGVAVLNVDDPVVAAMAARTGARVVTVGESGTAQVAARDVTLDQLGRASFRLVTEHGEQPIALRLTGAHHVGNVLAAAAVAMECGLPLADIAETLSASVPLSKSRMAVSERADGVVIVDDAYNANPESMRAALKTLVAMGRGRRTWAVLGEMAELGEAGAAAHDELGRLAVRLNVSQLLAVGAGARRIAQAAALEGSWDGEAEWRPDLASALELLRERLTPGDVVLVKASNSVGLAKLAAAVRDDLSERSDRRSGGES